MNVSLFSTGLPALVVAIGFFIAGKFKDPLRARLQGTVWAAAFIVGWMSLARFPLPFAENGNGFFWSTLLLTLFVWWSPKPVGQRYFVRAVFVVACGALLLWQKHAELGGEVNLRNMLAFFFLGLGLWSILERSSQQVSAPALILCPLISVAALGYFLVLRHSGMGVLNETVQLHGAMMLGALLIALARPQGVSAAAVIPFVSVFVVLLMACAHFYLNANPWSMIILCLPFVPLWFRDWLKFVPSTPLVEAAVLGVLGAFPIAYFFWH